MSQHNNGGQAFPIPDAVYPNGNVQPGCNGMTLRDYLAAKVMPELVRAYCEQAEYNGYEYQWMRGIAKDAYMMADAMISARENKP